MATSNDKYLQGLASKSNPTTRDRFKASERRVQPQVHGFLGALTDLPGMRLRKLADIPAVTDPKTGEVVRPGEGGELVYDFYNPFKEDPRPDEYSSYEEELNFKEGQGQGGLVNAATLLPALVRTGGRKLLGALANRKVGQAEAQVGKEAARTAEAADWMSPHVRPTPQPGPAMLGDEAMDILNSAAGRKEVAEAGVGAAKRGVQEAKQFGSSADDAINALTKSQTVMRPILGAASATANRAASELEQPPARTPTGTDVIPEMGDLQDVQVMPDQGQPQSQPQSAVDRYRQSMAGNRQLQPYKPGFIERIASFVNPSGSGVASDQRREAFMRNQMIEQGYMDPETQFKVGQLSEDLKSERGLRDTEAENNLPSNVRKEQQGFTERYAPAMETSQVEQQFGLPPGSLNPEVMERMGRGAPSIQDIMMLQLMQSMNLGATGGNNTGGTPGRQTPQLRVPQQ